jgi:mutator protein MutT
MPSTINVTAAIIVKAGKVLAARRKPGSHLAGYWEFPGGKIDDGESPEECLSRELTEEFSISTKIGTYVGESIFNYGTKVVRLMAYEVEHVAGDFELIDHDKLRWLASDELDQVQWAPADVSLVEQYKARASTQNYYDKNAEAYCEETLGFDLGETYKPFLEQITDGGHILDLGCGSGRDSKAFLNMGYMVTAIDGNASIAECAEKVVGQPVLVSDFQELAYTDEFDGIWACASLLHCARSQMPNVLERIATALKPNGLAYLSFKWGDDDMVDDRGRHFSNYSDVSLSKLLSQISSLEIVDVWGFSKPLRGIDQKWVNALVRKVGSNP